MAESSVTDWIQAIGAAAGVIGLAVYAYDTRQIREATLAQSEASRRPFLSPSAQQPNAFTTVFSNTGSGPALDVKCSWDKELRSSPLETIGSVGVGTQFTVDIQGMAINDAHIRKWGLRMEFEDTAGKKYWTVITIEGQAFNVRTGAIVNRLTVRERLERWNRTLEDDF